MIKEQDVTEAFGIAANAVAAADPRAWALIVNALLRPENAHLAGAFIAARAIERGIALHLAHQVGVPPSAVLALIPDEQL